MGDRSCLSVPLAAVAAVLALLLGSCGTPWSSDLDRNAIACQGYGFYPDSPEYAECMKYVEAREARRAALRNNPLPPSPNIVCQTSGSGTNCQTR